MNSAQPTFGLKIAVDTGNTRTSLALVNTEKLECILRKDIVNTEFSTTFQPALEQLLRDSPAGVNSINISSCIDKLFVNAASVCTHLGLAVNKVRAHDSLPVDFKGYRDYASLGPDRIADSIACNYLYPGEDCIKIGSGTALTIDLIQSAKVFKGGVIIPGIMMQLESLGRKTDALPFLQSIKDVVTDPPAVSTRDCMVSGVVLGTAGAINSLIEHYRKRSSPECRIVATGGAWGLTEMFLNFNYTFIPELTLTGTALYKPETGS